MRSAQLHRSPCHVATLAAIAAVTALVPAVGHPAPSEKSAEAYVQEAVSAFNLGRFSEASALFEKAYQLDPAPILLFNIGQSERRIGNNERALFFYRRFLSEARTGAPERKEVEERVAELERWVHEQAALRDRPPPGVQRDLAPAARASAGVREPQQPPPPIEPVVLSVASDGDGSRILKRRLAWAIGAVATASLVFGGIEAVLWSSRANRFDEHVGPSLDDPGQLSRNCGVDAPGRGGPGCAELYDSATTARFLAVTGLIGGVVLGASSAILFLRSAETDPANPRRTVACAPSLPSSGMICQFAF